MATTVCSTQGIHITFLEGLLSSDGLGADVFHSIWRMKGVFSPTAPRVISAGDHGGQEGTEFGGQRYGPYTSGTERARASTTRCCGTNEVKQMGPESVSGDVGPRNMGAKKAASGVAEVVHSNKAPSKEDEYTKNQRQEQEIKVGSFRA